MTGPEHYQQAERRLLMAWEEGRAPENVAHLVAEAQVHATLALTAAAAEQAGIAATAHDIRSAALDEWFHAIEAKEASS